MPSKIQKNLFAIVLLSSVLISCSHHKDVRAGAEGVHRVLVRGNEKSGAERKAIKEANHFCDNERNGTRAVFLNQQTQYTGSMDEDTRNTIKQASTAAMVVGNSMGDGHGSVLGHAGTAGFIMTHGDDYEAEMKFKCE